LHRGRINLAGASWELELIVQTGRDAGARCTLSSSHPSPRVVGQSSTCDFRLHDPAISRHHAAIDTSSWPVVIRDLASTNGTFVNGVAVVEARLFGGETVRIGETTLGVECRTADPRATLDDRRRFGRILGVSRAMRSLYPLCERMAGSSEPLVIEGEAGTGKALLAESLHEMGPRAMGPFVVLDCALGTDDLTRQQLHRGDAFERLLDQADRGTVLLDELDALDPSLQRALARALSGAHADVRILVTTRADPDALVRQGRFRQDLHARVAVARIELPPLRAREGDIAYLSRHFWFDAGGKEREFPADALARAEAHSWPGNVRELREFVGELLVQHVEAAAGTCPAEPATPGSELEAVVGEVLKADVSYAEARRRLLVEFERRYVERMLTAHHGNVTRAAAASGLARRNFQLIRARRRDEG
jgi:DNA-binding NtrC family response regulator